MHVYISFTDTVLLCRLSAYMEKEDVNNRKILLLRPNINVMNFFSYDQFLISRNIPSSGKTGQPGRAHCHHDQDRLSSQHRRHPWTLLWVLHPQPGWNPVLVAQVSWKQVQEQQEECNSPSWLVIPFSQFLRIFHAVLKFFLLAPSIVSLKSWKYKSAWCTDTVAFVHCS